MCPTRNLGSGNEVIAGREGGREASEGAHPHAHTHTPAQLRFIGTTPAMHVGVNSNETATATTTISTALEQCRSSSGSEVQNCGDNGKGLLCPL